MSFFKKLLGGTFESNRDEGDAFFDQGQFGEARLCYERAVTRAKGVASADVEAVHDKARQCRLALARSRIAEADVFSVDGDFESAVEQLREAREICSDADILDTIQERLKSYEAEDARRLVEEESEIGEEELLAIIAGTWIEPQADEYAALPDPFRDALIAGHDGDHKAAVKILEDILAQPDLAVSPCYLWLELGRARLVAEQPEGAIEALDAFVQKVGEAPDTIETTIAAHHLRAGAFVALEQPEKARDALVSTTRLAPEDHTTFLQLGIFLRSAKEYKAGVTALERARELMGQMQPDFRVIRELGFTYLAMARNDEAMDCLGAVIEHLASRGEHSQFDPVTAVSLARLHEEKGETMQAADLYRHLAVGYDTANHFVYNLEAARLLKLAGTDVALIDRYLTRAGELAADEQQLTLLENFGNTAKI